MDIKLTNGKKTITRPKEQYEANINHFTNRGFKLLKDNIKENVKEVDDTFENEVNKVVTLKPKKKKGKKK